MQTIPGVQRYTVMPLLLKLFFVMTYSMVAGRIGYCQHFIVRNDVAYARKICGDAA